MNYKEEFMNSNTEIYETVSYANLKKDVDIVELCHLNDFEVGLRNFSQEFQDVASYIDPENKIIFINRKLLSEKVRRPLLALVLADYLINKEDIIDEKIRLYDYNSEFTSDIFKLALKLLVPQRKYDEYKDRLSAMNKQSIEREFDISSDLFSYRDLYNNSRFDSRPYFKIKAKNIFYTDLGFDSSRTDIISLITYVNNIDKLTPSIEDISNFEEFTTTYKNLGKTKATITVKKGKKSIELNNKLSQNKQRMYFSLVLSDYLLNSDNQDFKKKYQDFYAFHEKDLYLAENILIPDRSLKEAMRLNTELSDIYKVDGGFIQYKLDNRFKSYNDIAKKYQKD